MKTIVLFGLLIVQSIAIFSQDHVFPTHGTWEFQNNQPFSWQNITYKRDTIINENKYEIIGTTDTKNDYAIRETPDKKVWVIYLNRLESYGAENDSVYSYEDETWYYKLGNDSSEYLLYDFGAQLNDTVEIYFPPMSFSSRHGSGLDDYIPFLTGVFVKIVVTSIVQIEPYSCVSGVLRNFFDLYVLGGYNLIVSGWLEGVGSHDGGPIFTETFSFFECNTQVITSTYEDGVLIYPCSSDMHSMELESELNIYPNPTDQTIALSSNKLIEKIVLLDNLGQPFFYLDNLMTVSYSIPLNGLNSGIFVIQIHTVDGDIFSRKIIKI